MPMANRVPKSLTGIKSLARDIKAQEKVAHGVALDMAAAAAGFPNFKAALNHHGAALSHPSSTEGQKVSKFSKSLNDAVFQSVASQLHSRLTAIRHPETGEFPTVVIGGHSLSTLSVKLEGSDALIAYAQQVLSPEDKALMGGEVEPSAAPKVFLSFTWDDHALAEKVATKLMANGIDTWWAEWEIKSGDSLRQMIDEGVGNCTHFIPVLTANSINKPWVKQEMDAGFVRKIEGTSKFIPLRCGLKVKDLPPLFQGMLSPEIDADARDLTQLINDIHGVTRKPPLGPKPLPTKTYPAPYSPAAMALAEIFVRESNTGLFFDPQYTLAELSTKLNLSIDDVKDATHELGSLVRDLGHNRVVPEDGLFAELDQHFMDWNPSDDALKLAADIVNDASFTSSPSAIATLYEWPARRLNAAISYLLGRRLIVDYKVISNHPYKVARVVGNDDTRRFVKSRS